MFTFFFIIVVRIYGTIIQQEMQEKKLHVDVLKPLADIDFLIESPQNKKDGSYTDSSLVRVSLKDLAKPSKINGLQAASKVLLS